jgi:CheY-like chemotaxis protein
MDDCEAILRAFRRVNPERVIHHCASGEDALDYLLHRGAFTDPRKAPRPALILLDLGLPRVNGHEVLRRSKADPEIRSIPIVILTGLGDVSDLDSCYADGASGYLQKPMDFNTFFDVVRGVDEYWFKTVLLPATPLTSR